MKEIKIIILFVWVTANSLAQNVSNDTLNILKPIEIIETRSATFKEGIKTEKFDSASIHRSINTNLSELLSNESLVFVKSYGPGQLATTSFRGASAFHTAVLWNGINLQSPLYGQLDFSLIPVNFGDDIQLQYGSAGALWGSGAVGGSILLNNVPHFNEGLKITSNTSYGSFENRQQQLGLSFGKEKFVSYIKTFYKDALNNFNYINTSEKGSPIETQSNAELKQFGLLQSNFLNLNNHQQLSTHLWYQFSDRNMPPSMTSASSFANQKDESYRATVEWKKLTENGVQFLARVALLNEKLIYENSTIKEYSVSKSNSFICEIEGKYHLMKYDEINVGINNTLAEANGQNYPLNLQQNRLAIFGNYKLKFLKERLNLSLNGRQEMIEGKAIPFIASVGMDGWFLKMFCLKLCVAQHYRIPTFNDLYYQGYDAIGNTNLKPENGWTEEVSIINEYSYKKFNWYLSATAFNRNIDNWIVWQPQASNANIWSTQNKLKVWSRGLEYKVAFDFTLSKLNFSLTGNYNFIFSTNQQTNDATDPSLGKQLIYVPAQNAQGAASIKYQGFSLCYTQSYVGYRFTTSDNTQWLNPYSLSNAAVSQEFHFKKINYQVYAQLNNILDVQYQIIAFTPMPGRCWQFGIKLEIINH